MSKRNRNDRPKTVDGHVVDYSIEDSENPAKRRKTVKTNLHARQDDGNLSYGPASGKHRPTTHRGKRSHQGDMTKAQSRFKRVMMTDKAFDGPVVKMGSIICLMQPVFAENLDPNNDNKTANAGSFG
ncbi:MAG: hypothetical protein M1831_004099 [Alyxoria varia]|nr:MAG: hypothetical protein M1831_004099 [Alyxoria varia]